MGGSKVVTDIESTEISTKTIIVATNTKFHIQKLFENMPITQYDAPVKKRGRKKREEIDVVKVEQNIPKGSIICLKYRENFRGSPLKKKKNYDNK